MLLRKKIIKNSIENFLYNNTTNTEFANKLIEYLNVSRGRFDHINETMNKTGNR